MEKYLERTKQPADLSPAPVCEYCGPKCLGGAAHFARSEDGAKQAIPASEQVREAEAVCARLALKPKTPEERQKQAIISVLTFQPEYNDHPEYNPDPDKLADAIVAALKDQLAEALKAAEQHYPACAMGQNLALGEGTHLEGTAEHPRHEFIGAPPGIAHAVELTSPTIDEMVGMYGFAACTDPDADADADAELSAWMREEGKEQG